jgi:hypothetical protein
MSETRYEGTNEVFGIMAPSGKLLSFAGADPDGLFYILAAAGIGDHPASSRRKLERAGYRIVRVDVTVSESTDPATKMQTQSTTSMRE